MKIIKITPDYVEFDNGTIIKSHHENDCCEDHYVDFTSLLHQGAEKVNFPESLKDLIVKTSYEENENDNESWRSFIQIKDKKGFKYTLTIYNSNNGYYSSSVELILTNKWLKGYEEKYLVQN